MKKIYINWKTIDKYITLLSSIIKKDKNIKYLVGIPRGGTIIANLLSYKTNIPVFSNAISDWSILTNDNINMNNILIIDDICDSGETILEYLENIFHYGDNRKKLLEVYKSNIKFATIYKHKDCKIKPSIYIKENTNWIVFPWEKNNIDMLSNVTIKNINKRRKK